MRLNHLRKRYKLLSDFKAMAAEMVNNINAKLVGGWSPFFESENTRLYTKLDEVIDVYLAEKEREVRPATFRSYKSWCKLFRTWCTDNVPGIYASMVNKVIIIQYLDYLYDVRKINVVNYNNHIKQGSAFFSWVVQKCYAKENPFEGIKKKKALQKTRIIIPEDYRQRITEYLSLNNPYFLIVCELVFSSLIRPKEIRFIQIKHISLEGMHIFIPSDNAKTHFQRYAALTPSLVEKLRYVANKQPNLYLFGPDMLPDKEPCHESFFTKQWDKMRKALKLPVEMQLYSLRDTGINNMLKSGIDPLTVMQHADHHDLAMTTRYANHADPNLIKKIAENAPKF
jgi:integrase